ncbi:hypothetical protein ACK9YZ_10990 [Rhizobium sp. ZK1]|uniref:hypothetical protein n=1 Tax=Rhizobium sp. ZK1 TaxID=3389872 RepID=UPI0039F72DFF
MFDRLRRHRCDSNGLSISDPDDIAAGCKAISGVGGEAWGWPAVLSKGAPQRDSRMSELPAAREIARQHPAELKFYRQISRLPKKLSGDSKFFRLSLLPNLKLTVYYAHRPLLVTSLKSQRALARFPSK